VIGDAFARPESAIHASAALVGVAALLSSSEWLALRRELGPHGCFAWKLTSSRPFLLRHAPLSRALSALYEAPGITVMVAVRALFALLLVVAAVAGVALAPPLIALALTSLVLHFRHLFSLDGSDQMILVVAVGLAVGIVLGAESLAVVFVACQAVASYFIAGLAKLRGREWRTGSAVAAILSTRSFGVPSVGAVLSEQRWMSRGVTWSTMSFEFLFPLALLAPSQVLLGVLAIGILFHFGAAVAMGLNVFPWAFLATYPCVIYLAYQL
jgi:hypothetical protein